MHVRTGRANYRSVPGRGIPHRYTACRWCVIMAGTTEETRTNVAVSRIVILHACVARYGHGGAERPGYRRCRAWSQQALHRCPLSRHGAAPNATSISSSKHRPVSELPDVVKPENRRIDAGSDCHRHPGRASIRGPLCSDGHTAYLHVVFVNDRNRKPARK